MTAQASSLNNVVRQKAQQRAERRQPPHSRPPTLVEFLAQHLKHNSTYKPPRKRVESRKAQILSRRLEDGEGGHQSLEDMRERLLISELRRLTDRLTRLWNEDGLRDMAAEMIANAQENGLTVQVFFLDMVGLQGINNTLGINAGNRQLVEAARILRRMFRRENDLVARLHGDEFVVVQIMERPCPPQKLMERLSKLNGRFYIGWCVLPLTGERQRPQSYQPHKGELECMTSSNNKEEYHDYRPENPLWVYLYLEDLANKAMTLNKQACKGLAA